MSPTVQTVARPAGRSVGTCVGPPVGRTTSRAVVRTGPRKQKTSRWTDVQWVSTVQKTIQSVGRSVGFITTIGRYIERSDGRSENEINGNFLQTRRRRRCVQITIYCTPSTNRVDTNLPSCEVVQGLYISAEQTQETGSPSPIFSRFPARKHELDHTDHERLFPKRSRSSSTNDLWMACSTCERVNPLKANSSPVSGDKAIVIIRVVCPPKQFALEGSSLP